MKITILLIASFLMSLNIFAQQWGDYGSKGSGNWGTDNSNWVRWDGTGWNMFASFPPSDGSDVYIRPGHTVTIEAPGKKCRNLCLMQSSTPLGGGKIITSATAGLFPAPGTNNITIGGLLTLQDNSYWLQSGSSAYWGTDLYSFSPSSTCEFTGTSTWGFPNSAYPGTTVTFGNLIWSAGTYGLASTTHCTILNVLGNLTINKDATTAGKLRGISTGFEGNITHSVHGDLICNNSSTANICLTGINGSANASVTWELYRDVQLNSGIITAFEGSGAVSPASAVFNINGNINLGSAGSFQFGSNAANNGMVILNLKGNLINSGSISQNLGASPGSLSVNFEGLSQSVSGNSPAGFSSVSINDTIGGSSSVSLLNSWSTGSVGGKVIVNTSASLATSGTFTNNGTTTINGSFMINTGGWVVGTTFVYGSNASLIINTPFTVNGNPYWPASNGPANVYLGAGAVTINVPRTVNGMFQTYGPLSSADNLTLNGTCIINSGGSISGAPVYGYFSTLIYNTGGTFIRNDEWGITAPANVRLSNHTTLYYNFSAISAKTLTGNLTIDGNSHFLMDAGQPFFVFDLIIKGNLLLYGSFSLGSTNHIAGNFYIGGNWTNAGGSFNPNNHTVTFNGSYPQIISGPTDFAHITIYNCTGVSLAQSSRITVSLSLDFITGHLIMNDNEVYIGSGASIGASDTAYCVTNSTGFLTQNVLPLTPITFPVGPSVTSFNPVIINYSSTANFSVIASFLNKPVYDTSRTLRVLWYVYTGLNIFGSATETFQWTAANEGINFGAGRSHAKIGRYEGPAGSVWTQLGTTNSGLSPFNALSAYEVFHSTAYTVAAAGGLDPGPVMNLTAYFEGLFDGRTIVPGTVTVELRNNTAPYNLVQSKNIFLNSDGVGSGVFLSAVDGSPYYLVVKQRNSLETWSASPQVFTNGILSYDFTSAASQAFGNNQMCKSYRYCIYSGDVNQDGAVDAFDLSPTDNDNVGGGIPGVASGLPTDITCDGGTDAFDLSIIDNNNALGISLVIPSGVAAPKMDKNKQ